MTTLLLGSFLAGGMGSPHCVGMCGGFAASARGTPEALAWQLGRLTTYTALGASAGVIGGLGGGPATAAVATVLLCWFAARLAGIAPALPIRAPWLTRAGAKVAARSGIGARYLFGVLTGLLPCGLVWSALAMAVAAGGGWTGAAAMGAFWLGTVPALVAATAGLRRIGSARPWTRRALAVGVLAAGLWSISVRVNAERARPACHPEYTNPFTPAR